MQAYIGRARTLALHCTAQRPLPDSLPAFGPCVAKKNMDVTIQHPWFKRALGPFYPSRLFDQFFGEGLFEYDLLPFLSATISPYYRQSLFRTVLDSGISEVRRSRADSLLVRGGLGLVWRTARELLLPCARL